MTIKTPYLAFGDLLMSLRLKAGIAKQSEFARLIKNTQQTVSRWERGASRPRDKEFPLIAEVLSADVGQLLAAAGYAQLVASATYDRPFPLGSIFPDSFERFALHFLAGLYPNAKVHPAGKSGHK